MKIKCMQCGTQGRVPDAKIPENGATLRCPKCKTRFRVSKQGRVMPLPGDAPSARNARSACTVCGSMPAGADGMCAACRSRGTAQQQEQDGGELAESWTQCGLCGKALPEDELVRIDGMPVCGRCKPDYVRRLSQGLTLPGEMRYAGFWIRAGAKIIDGMAQWVLGTIVTIPFMMLMPALTVGSGTEKLNFAPVMFMTAMMWLLQLAVPAAYSTIFIGRFGATPGKMLCRLKVVTGEGDKVSYPRALGRHFAEFLSGMILFVGYIMAAFDREKRTLHDVICNTRVVYK